MSGSSATGATGGTGVMGSPGKGDVGRAPGLAATVAAEWIKCSAPRFNRVMVVAALCLAGLGAAAFLLTTTTTQGRPLAGMGPVAVVEIGLLGTDLANLVLIVLSAGVVAAEFTRGQIRMTLTATPCRGHVVAAKVIVATAVALVVGVAAALGSHAVTVVVARAQDVPLPSLGDATLLRLIAGTALMVPFHSLLAASIAFVIRNTGGAVASVFVVMSVPAVIGALGEGWPVHLLPFLPATALHNLSGSVGPESAGQLSPVLAAGTLLAWTVLAPLIAWSVLERRDA